MLDVVGVHFGSLWVTLGAIWGPNGYQLAPGWTSGYPAGPQETPGENRRPPGGLSGGALGPPSLQKVAKTNTGASIFKNQLFAPGVPQGVPGRRDTHWPSVESRIFAGRVHRSSPLDMIYRTYKTAEQQRQDLTHPGPEGR